MSKSPPSHREPAEVPEPPGGFKPLAAAHHQNAVNLALASFDAAPAYSDVPLAISVTAFARDTVPQTVGAGAGHPDDPRGDYVLTALSSSAAVLNALAQPLPAILPGADDSRDVRASVAGDARAFERLYRRHIGRVYGLCWRLCGGDSAKADQAAQDAFVRAWEKLASFRGEAAFSTWLHRLTVNVVLGEQRLLKRFTSLDDVIESGGEIPSSHPQASLGDRLDIERALLKLPKGARAVLVLHDLEGWQHQEIAAATGIAVGTSKAQLHRARKLMKESLT